MIPLAFAWLKTMDTEVQLRDKTLVVWASPSNLTQRGGSALTLDDGASHFDGIVFGELTPSKWMSGSEYYSRTEKEQIHWPAEVVDADSFVQIAIVYQGQTVTLYRNGIANAHYRLTTPPQSFGTHSTVLFGRRHLDAKDVESSFAGRIKDARIYDRALSRSEISELQPGHLTGSTRPWAWWSFADQGIREVTGRFTEISLLGDVRLEKGCLVLGGKGASLVTSSVTSSASSPVPKSWSASGPVPEEVVRSARMLREHLLEDPYRPQYHFCVPEDMGIPGDPNGAFFANGRYHLMYLYNRTGSGFCWGHVSSTDLVHWRHHHDAIGPGAGDEGCFSGGAFLDDDGTAYLSYWMLWGAKGIGLAKNTDPDFEHWQKLAENPVIQSSEWGISEQKDEAGKSIHFGSADPSNIWKKDGEYYMLTGSLLVLNKFGRAPESPVSEQGDRLYLLKSKDLKSWKYLGVFYDRKPEWTDRSEDNMCPSFLPLPSSPDGGKPSGKHLLLFISHNKGCQYYVGQYGQDHFTPDNHGRMTWVDNTYFAPEALIDGHGRQIMWAWLTDNPPNEKANGWSGVYGLPRTLWLGEDGTLRMRPVKEIESLRGRGKTWANFDIPVSGELPIHGVRGDCFEMVIESTILGAGPFGVKLRASKDGKEKTLVYYDAKKGSLVMDTTKSGLSVRKTVESAPFSLKRGEPLKLRIFVDQSVVEVYANDRQAITRRVYPTQNDSLGISIFGNHGTKIKRVQAWEMSPSNPY